MALSADVFDLSQGPALGIEDYFVSGANKAAFKAIQHDMSWPDGRLAIVGAPRSGKTHLGHIWASRSEADIIPAESLADFLRSGSWKSGHAFVDDADEVRGIPDQEQALLHVCNLVLGWGGKLLVAACEAPARWKVELPDLASRLQTFRPVPINLPDDELLGAVIVKLFSDRQVSVAPAAVKTIIRRIDRSFRAAEKAVKELDQLSLANRRPVTQRLVSEWFNSGERNRI